MVKSAQRSARGAHALPSGRRAESARPSSSIGAYDSRCNIVCRNQRKPGWNRALHITLARLRVAEINEHAIALGHEAVEPGDRLRDALVIRPDNKRHVLRVGRGGRGRADEVGEHDGELATLGVILPSVSAGAEGAAAATEALPRSRIARSNFNLSPSAIP